MMHKIPYLYLHYHSKHHREPIIRSGDAIRHTFIDGTMNVMLSVIALKVSGAHPLSRTIYNALSIYMIAEAHSGYNFPWSLSNIIPFHIIGGPVEHEMHHRVGTRKFQTHFTYLDYLLETC
jgi:sterol desaturase/sphingolipid hydroxylase (fatty acid hydroxylase superfamily)